MQKLNIPLSRHTKTTRPLRQVVWLLGFFGLLLLFTAWRVSEQWFSRNEILQAAPQGTVLSIQLELTSKNWPRIQALLKNVPLITNRSLDIDDLAPFSQGEMAIFVTQTGERAVAIRTDESKLPKNLLNALSLTTAQITPDIVLLSSTLLPVSGMKSNVRAPLFTSLSRRWLGRIDLPDAGLSGSFYFYKIDNRLEIVFPNKNSKNTNNTALPQILLAFTGQKIDNQMMTSNYLDTIPILNDAQWSVLVNNNELGATELLFSSKKGDLVETDLVNLLQSIGAYLSPNINDSVLLDGTILRELIVDPALITIEAITLGEIQALRVLNEYNHAVYGAFIENQLVIATSEAMIGLFQQTNESQSLCRGNILQMNPLSLLDTTSQKSFQSSIYLLETIFSQFSSISLEMNKYSSRMTLCST